MSTYTYEAKDGSKITLPSMGDIPSGVLRKNRKLDEVDFVFTLVEETADQAAIDALDKLPSSELEDLFAGWQKDAGASVGESSRSST